MKPAKAIVLNAVSNTAEVVQIKDYTEIYKHGKFDLFDCVRMDAKGNTAYVDDEGLINGTTEGFVFLPRNQMLFGNIVILGTDATGESVDTTLTIEQVKDLFQNFSMVGKLVIPSDEIISEKK